MIKICFLFFCKFSIYLWHFVLLVILDLGAGSEIKSVVAGGFKWVKVGFDLNCVIVSLSSVLCVNLCPKLVGFA